ncbi:MAG: Crp/Fnr family transcriptional regulator, partial [Miltoncostaeaceae bacterium]
ALRLSVSDMLADLSAGDRRTAMAVLMRGRMLRMTEGDEGPVVTGSAGIVIVKYGELEVVGTTEDARELVLAHAAEGDLLTCPPSGIVDGGARIRALADSHLCPIDQEQLADLAPYPTVLVGLLSQCVRRVEEAQAAALRLAHRRVDDRVVLGLRALATRSGRVTRDGVRLPPVRHRELARIASVTRPGATQAIARLVASGHVRRETDGSLLLLDGVVLAGCRWERGGDPRPGG